MTMVKAEYNQGDFQEDIPIQEGRGAVVYELLKLYTTDKDILLPLMRYGRGILEFDQEDFMRHRLSPKHSEQLYKTLKMTQHLFNYVDEEHPILYGPDDTIKFASKLISRLDQEALIVLCLDKHKRLINYKEIFVGGLTSSFTHPREILRFAIKNAAYGIILVHNHPSSCPSPSQQDINVTHRIRDAAKIVGIKLFDHLVITTDKSTSIADVTYI